MILAIAFIINILVLVTRSAILRTLGAQATKSRTIIMRACFQGIVTTWILLLYPTALNRLGYWALIPTPNNEFIAWDWTLRYWIYIVIIGICFALATFKIARQEIRRVHGILLLITIARTLATRNFGATWAYIALAVGSEERSKSLVGQSIFKTLTKLPSDMIVVWMLAGLGFGVVETALYGLGIGSTATLGWLAALSILRGLSSTLLHILFTGLLGRALLQKHNQQPNRARAIVCAYGGHLLYNSLLIFHQSRAIVIILCCAYRAFSRLFYKTDRFYLDEQLPL